jgi:hypothetical protein
MDNNDDWYSGMWSYCVVYYNYVNINYCNCVYFFTANFRFILLDYWLIIIKFILYKLKFKQSVTLNNKIYTHIYFLSLYIIRYIK